MIYSYVPESRTGHDAWDPFAVQREPFPAPEVTSHDDPPEMLPPAPVGALAEFAQQHGWQVRRQYARGYVPHGTTGRPSALRESFALRFGAHRTDVRQAYACYERPVSGKTWAWDGIMTWGPDLPAYAGCGLNDLKTFLMVSSVTDTEAINAWVRNLKDVAANGANLVKRRAAVRKDVRQVVGSYVSSGAWPHDLLSVCAAADTLRTIRGIYDFEEIAKILVTRSNKVEKEGRR